MTNIRPHLNVPGLPGRSHDVLPPYCGPKGADAEFAASVPGAGGVEDDRATASTRADEAALRSAIAHVFNAYGFFAADSEQSAEPSPPDLATTAEVQPGETLPAQPTLQPVPPNEHSNVPERSLPPQASARAVALHGDVAPAPAPGSVANESSEHPRSGEPFLAAIENRLANEPERSEGANPVAGAGREAQAAQRDRVTLRIAEHGVELIARLSNLSDEEKQRLFDEINSLLAAHGLSLAASTINGDPLSRAARSQP